MTDDRTLSAIDDPGDGSSGSTDASAAFEIGRILGDRYRIESRLGRGGMGEVWRAVDLKLQVDVALKTLTSDGDAYRRELPRREVRAARQVVSPNVCRIYDLVDVEGQELVSMEYIDGQTLSEKLQADGALELHAAADIASQFLAGLESIHRAGLVHRDIKPANVMVTRAGRVVVMDFGLALPALEGHTVVGTPAYMPPEQLHGGEVDARSDVFAAGVLLAELIGQAEISDHASLQGLWAGVRQSPPVVPESPWREVLERAVDADPEKRYLSARALARALEEVTLRAGGSEDRTPYPGLAAFTAADAEFFFGREAEVEAVAKRLDRPRLQAIIGPSGTGKSSFVRAGLIPALGRDWGCVVCNPGSAPFLALGQALAPELAGDTEAVRDLMTFDQPDIAISVLARWRQRHQKALVVVDQFEELFTLNGEEIQAQFAELLSRAALEADVVVLLSMRDDFLYQCQSQEALQPIFADLVPIGGLGGEALRRALVQPALLCGYRFEDENLVEEMVSEVTEERGALPLLAFAARHLWERRDRERGLLTRAAYEEIGGVGGALAQHAEATLQRVGTERLPIVRELFRNLVTSEGTRAARSVGELMSLFSDDPESNEREIGREVLRALIDARLLTAYEVATPDETPDEEEQRVEIIHESLLFAWPRLVRWQTQDADGAQLRDQLRQAAQLWEARQRTEDLLWSGDSWREFQLWRERYPGALTAVEDDYAKAMAERAGRRQRRQRFALVAVLLGLLVVVGTVTTLWLQTESARRETESARLESEAGKLLALGRLQLDENPSSALAHALASLEVADNPEARRFAVEVLGKGPTASVLSAGLGLQMDFSPDGRWLASRNLQGFVLWSQEGGEPRILDVATNRSTGLQPFFRIGPESDLLITWSRSEERSALEFRSFPEVELLRAQEIEGLLSWDLNADGESLWTVSERGNSWLAQSRPLSGGAPTLLGQVEKQPGQEPRVDPTGNWLLGLGGEESPPTLRRLDGTGSTVRLRHEEEIESAWFSVDGANLATTDPSGEIRIWSVLARSEPSLRAILRGHRDRIYQVAFEPAGRRVASASNDKTIRIWDLEGPPEADPIVLKLDLPQVNGVAFHPQGSWVATSSTLMAIWPLSHRYSRVLHTAGLARGVTFAPDGSWVASSSTRGGLRLWPLERSTSRVLFEHPHASPMLGLDADPSGRGILAAGSGHGLWMVPLPDGEPRELEGFHSQAWHVALSPDGRLAAAGGGQFNPREGVIRIWDLETGEVIQILDPGEEEWIAHLHFTPDGRLVSGGRSAVRIWDLEQGTYETMREGKEGENSFFAVTVSPDGRFLASVPVVDLSQSLSSAPVLQVQDMSRGETWDVTTHGSHVNAIAIDPTSTTLVTVDRRKVVRAGPISGEEPHLLLGHESGRVMAVDLSPDGQVIATVGDDGTLRLWPMPEGQPFHTLAYEELLERLRALTNLRAVEDPEADGGYRIEHAPFPGWEVAPTW